MQAYVGWWILAAVLVGVELTSGTFYLLVYGLAAAAAGVAAWLGAGVVAQLATAGVIAVLGTLALRHWKRSTGHPESTVQDMDIGQSVQVESWRTAAARSNTAARCGMPRPSRPASTAPAR
jgi:membrane protein implicated in regulation of membrane protease activity